MEIGIKGDKFFGGFDRFVRLLEDVGVFLGVEKFRGSDVESE